MKQNVAQVLVRYLRERGVRHVFGVSAHSTFDITDAIYQEPGIDFVPAQIEVASGYMTNGYARATGQLAVNLVSSGGGATNAVSGVGQAYKESLPVLVLSSDVDRAHMHKGASSWHEIPQRELFEPLTKLSVTLQRAEDILEVLDDAVRTATSGRKGPVYLGIPRDLQVAEIEVPDGPLANGQESAPREPEVRLIAEAAELLGRAAAPIIIAGGGVHWAHAEAEVIELAELLGAPIGTSTSHKGLISEDHPCAIGVLGSAAAPYANAFCQQSDVILAVGATFSEPTTLGYGNQVIPVGAKIVQVDLDAGEIGKSYPAEVGIVGDAKASLQGIIGQLRAAGHRPAGSRLERLRSEKQAWRAEMAQRGQITDGPINQWQIYQTLRQVLDDDAMVVAEGGTQELIYRFVATSLIYHGGEFRPIGHGLGTALGLKVAFPDRQVVAVSGDGSFMMELQELATAAHWNLPIKVFVVHNGAYGNMKRDQVRHYDGRVIGTDLYVPDLPKLAESFGVFGARVEQPSELAGTLKAAMASDKPALVDIVCPIEGLA